MRFVLIGAGIQLDEMLFFLNCSSQFHRTVWLWSIHHPSDQMNPPWRHRCPVFRHLPASIGNGSITVAFHPETLHRHIVTSLNNYMDGGCTCCEWMASIHLWLLRAPVYTLPIESTSNHNISHGLRLKWIDVAAFSLSIKVLQDARVHFPQFLCSLVDWMHDLTPSLHQ